MPADLHHLHSAIAKVAPIVGISGDIADHRNCEIEFHESATDQQKMAALRELEAFDVNKKYDPDEPGFLHDVAISDNLSDAQYQAIFRAMSAQGAGREKILRRANFTVSQAQDLRQLAEKHCINLPV